jgi:hypothetical protein
MTLASLDATVELTVRNLLAIRAAALTPPAADHEPALTVDEHRTIGVAPPREKHVVVNLADLRHAQTYGVLDQYLDTLDQQTDVVTRIGFELDGFLRTATDDRPAVLTAPVPAPAVVEPTVQTAPAVVQQFAGIPAPDEQDDSF